MKKHGIFLLVVIISATLLGCTVNINVKDMESPQTIDYSDKDKSKNNTESEGRIDDIISGMSMDEKISQMIIPAIRTWDEENITDLDSVPEIKEALKKHQYGGIILFGANIADNEQVTRLLYDLQDNNNRNEEASVHIPYLTPVDEEGGIVIRLTSGTRMTGNMAVGATPDPVGNAVKTGAIIGEELAAAGFNVDYAPDIDVNNNPSNPVIGTRSFSDDPELVSELGQAYAQGLSKSNVIATFKHYPGHGDTGVDSHIGTPSVEKTYDELMETELVPFKKAIDNGADMIMTAHITYPLIDDEMTFGDGETKGYYPATMSKKMITDILRTDMGFDGVVVTDALEMDAIRTAGLVEGEEDSAEYRINIAKKVINAGVDMLLLPADMKDPEAVEFYDEYITGIASMVGSGEISEDRIDESVKRILTLKVKYGIFDVNGDEEDKEDIEDKVQNSLKIIGSKSHHDAEMEMARESITLLKNDKALIPVSKDVKKIVLLGRLEGDAATLKYAADEMKKEGLIDEACEVSVDYYYDPSADVKLNYTEDMKEMISSADIVIGFSYASGSSTLNKENAQYIGLHNAMEDVHAGGGKFILASENLPYDAAVYQDADAIVLAYMGSGLNMDPTDKTGSGTVSNAINANIIAAVETIFGYNSPKGKLPVNIPVVEEKEDGTLGYGSEIMYERGFGITEDPSVPTKYVSEGVDTKCEITGYSSYKGGDGSYFLSEGDKVAVISPSALPSRKQVDATIEGIKKWGFIPIEGKYICPESRTLDETIEDLEWALNDTGIKAIFCVRGGYGASEVMDRIPIEMIKKADKPIIGYSDITVYHSAWTTAGLPSIHACMSGTFGDFPKDCADAQSNMMMGQIPEYRCKTDTPCINGKASGILIGGNLSTFTSVLNTAYDCTKTDEPYILFIEEVGENMQHIHRYLTVLKHMGVLDRASGIIFGEWTDLPADMGDYNGKSRGGEFKSVADMITREFLTDTEIPVAFGFPSGHGDVNYPLLMGEEIHLNVSDDSYTQKW